MRVCCPHQVQKNCILITYGTSEKGVKSLSIFTRRLISPPSFRKCGELSTCPPVTDLATWFPALQRAAAFLSCCFWWPTVASSAVSFQIFWQTLQTHWSRPKAVVHYHHNFHFQYLQVTAWWTEKLFRSRTETGTWEFLKGRTGSAGTPSSSDGSKPAGRPALWRKLWTNT